MEHYSSGRKRSHSKSSWLFGRGNPIFLGFKPLFSDCFKAFFGGFSPKILSKVFPERSARSNNLICGAVLKWSKRRDSKSRRTVRLPGFKSLLLRQTEWTDEFYSSVHSFLPEQRPLHPVFLGLGIMRMHCHSPDIPA